MCSEVTNTVCANYRGVCGRTGPPANFYRKGEDAGKLHLSNFYHKEEGDEKKHLSVFTLRGNEADNMHLSRDV